MYPDPNVLLWEIPYKLCIVGIYGLYSPRIPRLNTIHTMGINPQLNLDLHFHITCQPNDTLKSPYKQGWQCNWCDWNVAVYTSPAFNSLAPCCSEATLVVLETLGHQTWHVQISSPHWQTKSSCCFVFKQLLIKSLLALAFVWEI